MATPAPAVQFHPAPLDKRGTIPDLDFIKRRVPVADVARALDICIAGNNTAHCWRPNNHEHGDRSPSVWFSRRSNRGQCKVCDRFTWSNIDLVQVVLGCDTAAAVNWIAERFYVPRIAKRRPMRNGIVVPPGRVGCGSPVQNLMRSGVFAKLTHATKVVLFVLVELCEDGQTLNLSYRALQRVSGISSKRTLNLSLGTLENMGLLKIKRGRGEDRLSKVNGYHLMWDDAGLRRLMLETHESTTREIKAEQELREGERAVRAAYLGKPSVSSGYQPSASVVSPEYLLRNEGRAKRPRPETASKDRKVTA